MSDFVTRRGATWHFVRRVPAEFAHLDRRGVVRHSTRIKVADDRIGRRATRVAHSLNEELEHLWKQLADGQSGENLTRYDEARRRARALGFDYIPNSELISLPQEKRLERLEALVAKGLTHDPSAREALLGTAQRPSFNLSRLFEEYEAATKDEVMDLSRDQLRIWRNGRIRAVAQFVQVVGDKLVTDLTHADAIEYREWWRERVVDDDVAAKTANKDMGQLSRMLKDMSIRRRLNLPDIFKGLHLRGETEKSRLPYEPSFIQTRFLAGALDGLNEDARFVLYVMIETGLRPSEIVNLREKTIVLDARVPHVRIVADGRRLKTERFRTGNPACRRGAQSADAETAWLSEISRQGDDPVGDRQQIPAGKRIAPDPGPFGLLAPSQLQGSARGRRGSGQPDRQLDGP